MLAIVETSLPTGLPIFWQSKLSENSSLLVVYRFGLDGTYKNYNNSIVRTMFASYIIFTCIKFISEGWFRCSRKNIIYTQVNVLFLKM